MRLHYILLAALLFFAAPSYAQQNGKKSDKIEIMPRSGYDLGEYLGANLVYPEHAREKNIEGRVVVKFVVNEDGHISNAEVTKGIGGGCDEEAIRVVSSMPRWIPGEQDGKKVKVYFSLPINFKLEDETPPVKK